jgi:hypothetical protein
LPRMSEESLPTSGLDPRVASLDRGVVESPGRRAVWSSSRPVGGSPSRRHRRSAGRSVA